MPYNPRTRSSFQIATANFPGPFGETREEGSGNGTALTAGTTTLINIFPGTSHLSLITRNLAGGAVSVRYNFNPYILQLVTNDHKTFTDNSVNAQGTAGGRALILDGLAAFAWNGGAYYIGSHLPIRGLNFTSNQANAVVSTLTGFFWNGTAWASLAGFTDNTAVGGATFAQSGTITWTVPTTAAKAMFPLTWPQFGVSISGWASLPGYMGSQNPVAPIMFGTLTPYSEKPRYWYQLQVSAALTSPTSGSLMLPFNRSTTYSDHIGADLVQKSVFKGPDGDSCIEATVDAGTANLIVNGYNESVSGAF
jgi:hypothetical protein